MFYIGYKYYIYYFFKWLILIIAGYHVFEKLKPKLRMWGYSTSIAKRIQ